MKMTVFAIYLLLLFYALGTIAEEFFCPTLSQISEMLRMSPDVAGITILALGNGAPDLFSSFAAVTQGQLPIALGALVGAGSFVTLVVVGAVALSANCTVRRFPFIRDVSGYLMGSSAVCAIVLSGGFQLWMPILFLVYYLIYVSISIGVNVYNNRRAEARQQHVEMHIAQLAPEETEEISKFYSEAPENNEDRTVHVYRPVTTSAGLARATISFVPSIATDSDNGNDSGGEDNDSEEDEERGINGSSSYLTVNNQGRRRRSLSGNIVRKRSRNYSSLIPRANEEEDDHLRAEVIAPVTDHYRDVAEDNLSFLADLGPSINPDVPRVDPLTEEDLQEAKRVRRLSKYWCKYDREMFSIPWRRLPSLFLRRIEWQDKSLLQKIGWIIVSPITLVLNLTIPQIEDDSWHKFFAVLNPIFAPLQMSLVAGWYDVYIGGAFPLPVLLVMIGSILSVAVFFTTTSKKPRRIHAFLLAAFLLSIFWIYLVANELVSLLQSIGLIFNISPAILGLTVLAWGNSTGDLISDIVVAKQGFPEMALAATFGGPLFNMLLGLGISLTVVCSQIFPAAYPATMSPELAIGFSFLAIGLASTLMTIPYAGFVIPRKYALYLIFIYVLQSLLSVLVETGVIHF